MSFTGSNPDFNDDTLVSCLDEAPLWSAPFGKALLAMVDYKKGITALDIGFGTGYPFLELAMRLGSSSLIYGIDPWAGAVRRTKLKAKQYSIDNIRIIESPAEKIPLPDSSVDLIVSNNGLNNVTDLSKVIAECCRIARPSCQFLMTMNLNTTMTEFLMVQKQLHGHAFPIIL
jgi:ubiquinone/menaquinone biosynthesis C-methylase UbiE